MVSSPIRTPDQRLRVFVSSTLGELAEERKVVARAIEALRLIPVMFELGARPHPPQELYRAYLAQSDIFVGLYWQRYGWVGPGMEISGLEDEFRLSEGLPRLLYLKAPAPEREPGLTAMIESLQTEGTDAYRTFRNNRELGQLVRDDLAVLLSERFAAAVAAVDPGSAVGGPPRQPRSLPVATTTLYGRDHDIDQVVDLLETPEVRLVTLTGPGGIGKTRLAVAVGERLDDRYPLGTVFVPLGSIDAPGLVMPRIATALSAPSEGSRSPVESVAEHLGDTQVLLILDNLEQVVAVAPELDQLLARCPGITILATSRTVLRLRAERDYPVASLAVPSSLDDLSLGQLAALPAVALFVDRASAVRANFALADDNAAAVAEICRRLDGLPLAIELAAARIRLLEPDALLVRLSRSLDALGTGPVDLPERQRTLRQTVEWSVGLLADAERRMLAALTVFVDGWTLDAAQSVADLDENATLDLLDALVGQSLITVVATASGPRFRMLTAVREYAAELLDADPELTEVPRRHADYFRRFAETADWRAIGPARSAALLQQEEGNLRAAVHWFLDHDIAPLPHLFRIFWMFWWLREHIAEGRAWIDELLPRVDEYDSLGRAEFYLMLGMTSVEGGDDTTALVVAEELDRLRGQSDDFVDSLAQLTRSWILPLVDDYAGAAEAARLAHDGLRRLDDTFMSSGASNTLGMLEEALGRYDSAVPHFQESVAMGENYGANWNTSIARVQLANIAIAGGRVEEGRARLHEALDAGSTDGGTAEGMSTQAATFCLVTYARLALADGDAEKAAVALGAAAGLRERAGLRVWSTARKSEAELLATVEDGLDPHAFASAFETGFRLSRREAIAMMRGQDAPNQHS